MKTRILKLLFVFFVLASCSKSEISIDPNKIYISDLQGNYVISLIQTSNQTLFLPSKDSQGNTNSAALEIVRVGENNMNNEFARIYLKSYKNNSLVSTISLDADILSQPDASKVYLAQKGTTQKIGIFTYLKNTQQKNIELDLIENGTKINIRGNN